MSAKYVVQFFFNPSKFKIYLLHILLHIYDFNLLISCRGRWKTGIKGKVKLGEGLHSLHEYSAAALMCAMFYLRNHVAPSISLFPRIKNTSSIQSARDAGSTLVQLELFALIFQASSTESDPRCPVILTSQWSLSYCGLTREQSNYIFYWSLTNLSYQFPREIVDSKRIISRIYKSIPWSWWCILRHQILSTILVDPVWEWENISSPSALQLNLRLLWDWERVGSTGALITHVLTYHWSWLGQWSHWCWCQ